jgi:hypothetical protein
MQHAETAGAFENSRKAAVSGDAARFLLFSGAVRVVVGGACSRLRGSTGSIGLVA